MITKTVPHTTAPDLNWLVYFEHESASANIAILADYPHTAYLYDMQSKNPRQKHGTQLLQEIDAYGIEHEISIIIDAEVYDGAKGCIDNQLDLLRFYLEAGATYIGRSVCDTDLLFIGDPENRS